jgi:hypothetical protein
MIKIDYRLEPKDLQKKLALFWELSAEKIKLIDKSFNPSKGSPVFTVDGKYTTADGRNGPRDSSMVRHCCNTMQRVIYISWNREEKPPSKKWLSYKPHRGSRPWFQ